MELDPNEVDPNEVDIEPLSPLPPSQTSDNWLRSLWTLLKVFLVYIPEDRKNPWSTRGRYFIWLYALFVWAFGPILLAFGLSDRSVSNQSHTDAQHVFFYSVSFVLDLFITFSHSWSIYYFSRNHQHVEKLFSEHISHYSRSEKQKKLETEWLTRAKIAMFGPWIMYSAIQVIYAIYIAVFSDVRPFSNSLYFIWAVFVGIQITGSFSTLVLFFLVITRLLKKQIDIYLQRLITHTYETPDAVTAAHLAHLLLVESFSRSWRLYLSLMMVLVIAQLLLVLGVVYWMSFFTSTTMYSMTTVVFGTVFILSSVVYFTILISVLFRQIALLNSRHDKLKRDLVIHSVFNTSQRVALQSELELVPLHLNIYGLVMSTPLLKTLLSSFLIAVSPALMKFILLKL